MGRANSRSVDAVQPIGMYHSYPSMSPGDIFQEDNETTPNSAGGRYHNVDPDDLPLGLTLPALGSEVRTWDGRVFRYIYNAEGATAIAQGNTVAGAGITAFDTIVSYTADPPQIDTGETLTAGAHIGSLVYVDEGTGAGQTRICVAHTDDTSASIIYLDRRLDTALDTTSDLTLIPIWRVIQGTDGAAVCGVMPFAASITAGNYGWIQVKGVCEAALIGDGGVTKDDILTTVATAGTLGVAAATEAETNSLIGVALATAGATELAPVYLTGFGWS